MNQFAKETLLANLQTSYRSGKIDKRAFIHCAELLGLTRDQIKVALGAQI